MDNMHEEQRWFIIGRLTASLFHEINNPMQAISGAMSLALEELDDPEALRAYIGLSLQESDRVIELIAQARRIYRREPGRPGPIDVNDVVDVVLALTQKKMKQARVRVETKLAPEPPPVTAVFSDLALAILCPLLQLVDSLEGNDENGRVLFRTRAAAEAVSVEFQVSHRSLASFVPDLSFCRSLLDAHRGALHYAQEGRVLVTFTFPRQETDA
jgi:nitrogen-specific signal transduction histidine kinase